MASEVGWWSREVPETTEAQRMMFTFVFWTFKTYCFQMCFSILLFLMYKACVCGLVTSVHTLQVSVTLVNVNSDLLVHYFETGLCEKMCSSSTLICTGFWPKLICGCSTWHIFKIPRIKIYYHLWGMWEKWYKPLTQPSLPGMSKF